MNTHTNKLWFKKTPGKQEVLDPLEDAASFMKKLENGQQWREQMSKQELRHRWGHMHNELSKTKWKHDDPDKR